MKKPLESLEKIIKLAEERNTEEERLEEKHEIGFATNFLDENITEFMKEPRPKKDKLVKYLSTLNEDEMIYVATVMYGGRDYLTYGEKHNFEEMYIYLKGRKKGLVYSVVEKKPLPDYLRAGIKIFKIK